MPAVATNNTQQSRNNFRHIRPTARLHGKTNWNLRMIWKYCDLSATEVGSDGCTGRCLSRVKMISGMRDQVTRRPRSFPVCCNTESHVAQAKKLMLMCGRSYGFTRETNPD